MRFITLEATGKKVTLTAYVKAVKLAKDNPTATFKYGLTTWWPVTGAEIVQEFLSGVNDRINLRGGIEQYKGYNVWNDARVLRRLSQIRELL